LKGLARRIAANIAMLPELLTSERQ